MPGLLRIVDDKLWEPTDAGWPALASHLVPLQIQTKQNTDAGHDAPRYEVTISKMNYGVGSLPVDSLPAERERARIWEGLMSDEGSSVEGTPVRAVFLGQQDGVTQRTATSRQPLKRTKTVSLCPQEALPWVPEVVRIELGHPVFLEVQLLTGAPCHWMMDGLGPQEDHVLGGEWDVLCLDKRGPGDQDFHQRWTKWYRDQGVTQAFRTALFYSSRDSDPPQLGEDAFLDKEAVKALPAYPQRFPLQPGSVGTIANQAREHLAWRTGEGPLDDLVLPISKLDQWKGARIAAESSGGVLIHGPSGTGKSAMARLVHRWSGRAPARFVYANCGALTDELAKDELYGHVRGAFTGAESPKLGLLTLADGGSLFLDEVHLLSGKAQALLLDVLDRKKFVPVGATRLEHVDVRILCGSNDPAVASDSSTIRPDLRHRLFHSKIHLEPIGSYAFEDFKRLCEVCWERLKDDISEHFDGDANRWLGSGLRGGVPELDDLKDEYAKRAPRRSLFASSRIRERIQDLQLDEDAYEFLFGAREDLATSNARGLIAWLWRSMLRCPIGSTTVDAQALELCGPRPTGLVADQHGKSSPLPETKIATEAALASDLFGVFSPEPGSTVDFTWSLSRIGKRLGELYSGGALEVPSGGLCEFLLESFRLLLNKFKPLHVKWERPDRPSAPSAFHNKSFAYRALLDAALPAFRIYPGDQAYQQTIGQFDAWMKRNSRTGKNRSKVALQEA